MKALTTIISIATAVITAIVVWVFRGKCCEKQKIRSVRGLTYCENCKTIQ